MNNTSSPVQFAAVNQSQTVIEAEQSKELRQMGRPGAAPRRASEVRRSTPAAGAQEGLT